MSEAPFMPKATAVWLVENTTLSFKQIANFCNLHELEVKGIADGDVAKGIKAYNPILAGQLTRDEIDLSSKDHERPLKLFKKNQEVVVSKERKKVKYTPLSKRKDRPDTALWLVKNFSQQLNFFYSFKYNEYNDNYIKLNYVIFLGSGIPTLLYPAST